MLGLFIILVILAVVFLRFRTDYNKGLSASLFFIILMPPNSTIELSAALPSFTIHRLILFVWFVMWIRNKTITKRLGDIPFFKILLMISAVFAVSTALSSYLLVSIKRYFYFLIEAVLFFIMLQTSLKNRTVVSNVVIAISASLAVVAFIGVLEKYTGFNPSPYLGEKLRYEFEVDHTGLATDIISTYLHRILFGIAMAIGMMHYFYHIDKMNTRLQNIIYWLLLSINGAGLYFSLSRGPWLAFVVSILLLLVIAPKEVFIKSLVLMAVVGIVFIIKPGAKSTIMGLARSTGDETSLKGASFRWRFIVWNMAYTSITKSSIMHTIFGYGGGSHLFMEFGRVLLPTGHSALFESWDMEYAVILFEQGFVGFFLTLFFYIAILKKSIAHCFRKKQDYKIMQLALACFFIIVFMKTNVNIYAPQLDYIEYVYIAIISALTSERYQLSIDKTDNEKQ